MSNQDQDRSESTTGVVRQLIVGQIRLSEWLDRTLPANLRISGSDDFTNDMVRLYVRQGFKVCDIGGGSRPFFNPTEKAQLNLEITGLDIDAEELATAPVGSYDRTICADLTALTETHIFQYDLVICRTVLEHVPDNRRSLETLASMLRPGGNLLIFVPNKFAFFALINRLLPEKEKKAVLFRIFPHKNDGHSGFPAYYNRCTPRELSKLAHVAGLEQKEIRFYYWSSYLTFFFPFHALYQLVKLAIKPFAPEAVAETFAVAYSRPNSSESKRFQTGSDNTTL